MEVIECGTHFSLIRSQLEVLTSLLSLDVEFGGICENIGVH